MLFLFYECIIFSSYEVILCVDFYYYILVGWALFIYLWNHRFLHELRIHSLLNLIYMIIKHTKHTINILRSITTCTPSLQNTLLSKPAYPFSSSTWNKDKVLNKINKEIIDSQTAILNKDKDEDAYFRTLHWKIRFD